MTIGYLVVGVLLAPSRVHGGKFLEDPMGEGKVDFHIERRHDIGGRVGRQSHKQRPVGSRLITGNMEVPRMNEGLLMSRSKSKTATFEHGGCGGCTRKIPICNMYF